jgi:Cu-Zn family superoxide dismutase
MKTTALIALALLVPTFILQAANEQDQPGVKHGTKAVCVIEPRSGTHVKGLIWFTQEGHMVHVKGEITGLQPGKHGFHVHEFGDISSKDGMSTGGHYDPDHGKTHGRPDDQKRHVGDLGNITADDTGKATIDITDSVVSLHGPHSIVGRALVVHEKEDDYSQPVGNAGKRYGVGVIGVAK